MSPARSVDVAIVGYGPTGAALANLLGICGITTVVLERQQSAYHLPRAVHFDDEVMRFFQTLGLANQIGGKARFNPGMRFVNAAGDVLLNWPRPEGISRNGWHSSYRFHQPDLEQILRQGLDRFSQVSVLNGAQVVAIENTSDTADVHYETTDSRGTVSARYVVGCDGSRSLVRNIIGSDTDDFGFRERWLVIDVLLQREVPELGTFTVQYCDPDRPCTYVCGPQNRRRWEIRLLEHEDASSMTTPRIVWDLISRWLSPDDAILERAAVYTFHSMIASRWRRGRILLAGDAAHQMPPFMGQGMCAGMRDVANLGWKLRAQLHDESNDVLLDSYQAERYPHVKAYIDTAMRLGGLINTCDTEAGLRLAFGSENDRNTMKSITPQLGESLSVPGDKAAGELVPQPALLDGTRLDDYCGYTAVLLTDCTLVSGEAGLPGLRVVEATGQPELSALLDHYQANAILIRPDRYLLGTASNVRQLRALLSSAKSLCC